VERDLGRALLDGFEAELRARSLSGLGLAAETVYLGGGTPSLLGAEGIRALCAWVAHNFDTSDTREWTVELNPEHLDSALLDALAGCGVTRVSLGVQSLRSRGLEVLGRVHGPAQARRAVTAVVEAGFEVSADLIVGWPGDEAKDARDDARELVELGVGHVSAYGMTVEEGSAWPALVRRGVRELPDEDRMADALAEVAAVLLSHGFDHYEVSSYAKPGRRAAHNSRYWSGEDVLALGPSGTTSRHRRGRTERYRAPRGWDAWRASPGGGETESLSGEAAAAEALWLGLRRLDGVDIIAFLQRFSAIDAAWLDARIARQRALGNLVEQDGRLAVDPQRWLHHDSITAALIA
jgi:oxygen-independent coproporphyrinogen-3 oxidase